MLNYLQSQAYILKTKCCIKVEFRANLTVINLLKVWTYRRESNSKIVYYKPPFHEYLDLLYDLYLLNHDQIRVTGFSSFKPADVDKTVILCISEDLRDTL